MGEAEEDNALYPVGVDNVAGDTVVNDIVAFVQHLDRTKKLWVRDF